MNMSGKWTPGPWRYSDLGTVIGLDEHPAAIALTSANARLIAAAPDLYEALSHAVALNDEFRSLLPANWESDPLNDHMQGAAKAALARARGDKPTPHDMDTNRSLP